jgi:hypothetical protein
MLPGEQKPPKPPPPPLDRRLIIGLAFAAFILVFLLWQTHSVILYPFRLLVTFIHEMGHVLTTIVSGGQFVSFHVFGDGSGVTFSDGGSRYLILPAGYLGSALFGAVLLYAANRVKRVRWVAFVCGVFFISTALIFSSNVSANLYAAVGSVFALILGITAGLGLIALGRFASRWVTVLVLNTLAFIAGFEVLNDFLFLLSHQSASLGEVQNDASQMAQLMNTSTLTWIIVWAALAILMVGGAAIMAFVEPGQKQSILPAVRDKQATGITDDVIRPIKPR